MVRDTPLLDLDKGLYFLDQPFDRVQSDEPIELGLDFPQTLASRRLIIFRLFFRLRTRRTYVVGNRTYLTHRLILPFVNSSEQGKGLGWSNPSLLKKVEHFGGRTRACAPCHKGSTCLNPKYRRPRPDSRARAGVAALDEVPPLIPMWEKLNVLLALGGEFVLDGCDDVAQCVITGSVRVEIEPAQPFVTPEPCVLPFGVAARFALEAIGCFDQSASAFEVIDKLFVTERLAGRFVELITLHEALHFGD